MAKSPTAYLALLLPVPGSKEPFRVADVNEWFTVLDAKHQTTDGAISALDGRLDTLEGVPAGLVRVARQEFTAQATVSLDNVFTSAYDDYQLNVKLRSASANSVLRMRMRAGGVDNAGAAAYAFNIIQYDTSASGTASGGVSYFQLHNVSSSAARSCIVDLIDPALANATLYTSTWTVRKTATTVATGVNGGAHDVSSVFDGFTLFPDTGTITGVVEVFGYRKTV
jgi:hypothetical protein